MTFTDTDFSVMTPSVQERIAQQPENLPQEIIIQRRFFAVDADKVPKIKGWSNPDNQKLFSEVEGLAGFDTSGHDVADDYILFDFDHVLNGNGEFVNAEAEAWFNLIQKKFGGYCERSISGRGLHVFGKPSPNKFPAISNGKNGVLHFDRANDVKLELFYKTKGRYCLMTGNLFDCEAQAPIASGEVVDNMFQTILAEIQKRLQAEKTKPNADTPARKTQKKFQSTADLDTDYDLWRAEQMLDCIDPSRLEDSEWFAVISACKNIGVDYSAVDVWNSRDPERYNEEENQTRWDSQNDPSYSVSTLHGIAKQFGYSEKDARREWYQLHPELKSTDRADLHPDLSETPSAMNDDEREDDNTPCDDFIWTQDKIKSCPVNLRLPPDYIFSKAGITQVVELKSKTKYIPVTKTAIIPTKIFFEPVKGIDEYEIAILSRGKWRRVEVDAKTLGDAKGLNVLCSSGALILDNTRLKVFLAELIALNPDMPEIKAYAATGWTDDTFTTFAYPGKEDCVIRRAGFDFAGTLAKRGNAEKWKQKFIEVADRGGAIVHAYIGTALASILARPLNFMNPQAHLQGTSGSAKTALQKFTASIFGNPRELMKNFAATNKYRQLTAAAFCDLPSFYDELETVQSKSAEETLSTDIYNFADGKGNQANKRDGTARETFRFGGARLTTGERPILKQNDLRGAYKRILQFQINDKLFDDEFASDLHIFAESNFGHYALQWIQYAQEHMKEIQADYHNFAKSDPTTRNYEPTHLKMLAAGLVAFEYFKVATGITAEFDAVELVRDRRYLIDYQLPTLDQIDDTTRAIEFLKSFVAGNDKAFAHEVDKPGFDDEFTQSTPECIGKRFKNGEVAFLPHTFTEILEKRGGFNSADKLRNDFCQKGFLRHKEGTMTFPTWFNGRATKMIRFKANVLSTPEEGEKERVQTNSPYHPYH